MKLLRTAYDWALHWAATPYALPALCAISFVESSFFPIPPDITNRHDSCRTCIMVEVFSFLLLRISSRRSIWIFYWLPVHGSSRSANCRFLPPTGNIR